MFRALKQVILAGLMALFASQASAMFIQPDWLDPTEPGVGTNRYAYSANDPINNMDPLGNSFWSDLGNSLRDTWSAFKDSLSGNYDRTARGNPSDGPMGMGHANGQSFLCYGCGATGDRALAAQERAVAFDSFSNVVSQGSSVLFNNFYGKGFEKALLARNPYLSMAGQRVYTISGKWLVLDGAAVQRSGFGILATPVEQKTGYVRNGSFNRAQLQKYLSIARDGAFNADGTRMMSVRFTKPVYSFAVGRTGRIGPAPGFMRQLMSNSVNMVWTCHVLVPLRLLIYAAFASKAKGLFQPKAECFLRAL